MLPMRAHESLHLRADVRLADLSLECAPRMYAWMEDPEVRSNIGLRGEPSLEKTRNWITNTSNNTTIRAFAILLDNTHVGNVVLDQIDTHLSKARFSIYIGDRSVRAQGVGSTATYLALKTAFRELWLHKVWLTVHARNTRAIRAYTRVGFQLEGILRGEYILDGERLPAWYMGILAGEFEAINVEI